MTLGIELDDVGELLLRQVDQDPAGIKRTKTVLVVHKEPERTCTFDRILRR